MITLTPRGRSLLKRVCKAIMKDVKHFDMGDWIVPHRENGRSCGTTACIAGHIVLQAGYPAPVNFHAEWSRMPANISDRLKRIFLQTRACFKGRLFSKVDVPRLATALLTGDAGNVNDLDPVFYVGTWPRQFANQYYVAVDDRAKAEVAVARIKHLLETGV